MKLFHKKPDFGLSEAEEIRGVADADLGKLPNNSLICLALARLYEGVGIEDDKLILELYRRGRKVGRPSE